MERTVDLGLGSSREEETVTERAAIDAGEDPRRGNAAELGDRGLAVCGQVHRRAKAPKNGGQNSNFLT